MATVHPSRLGLVPSAPPEDLIHRPESSKAAQVREEELRQQLRERRKSGNSTHAASPPKLAIRGRAQGKELIDIPQNGESSSPKRVFGGLEDGESRGLDRQRRKESSPPHSGQRIRDRDRESDHRQQSHSNSIKERLEEEEEDARRSRRGSPRKRDSPLRRQDGSREGYRNRSPEYRRREDDDRQRSPRRLEDRPRDTGGGSSKWDQMPSGMHPSRYRQIRDQPSSKPISESRPQPYHQHQPQPEQLPPLRFTLHGPSNGFGGDKNGRGTPMSSDGDTGSYNASPAHHPPPKRFGYGGGIDFEKRRLERERSTISVWPASPKEPYRDPEEIEEERRLRRSARKKKESSSKSKSKSKRRKRRYTSETPSSDDVSAHEDDESIASRHGGRRTKRRYSDEESESDGADLSDKSQSDKKKRRKYGGLSRESIERDNHQTSDDGWVEKRDTDLADRSKAIAARDVLILPPVDEDVNSDEEVGPRLPVDHASRKEKHRYFKDMLPGEAEAMAAYAASGQRIPRRGEIGLDSEQISTFEELGYVMSGNRNKRMNAVRLRKENQVISAEEKRAILNLQREERVKKEGAIISQFKELMDQNLRKQGLNKE